VTFVRLTGTILLVEDSAALRLLLGQVLKQAGYQILEASSAMSGLAPWEKYRAQIDLLFTGLKCPGP
jgi:CheY-like chemotaxis protein